MSHTHFSANQGTFPHQNPTQAVTPTLKSDHSHQSAQHPTPPLPVAFNACVLHLLGHNFTLATHRSYSMSSTPLHITGNSNLPYKTYTRQGQLFF